MVDKEKTRQILIEDTILSLGGLLNGERSIRVQGLTNADTGLLNKEITQQIISNNVQLLVNRIDLLQYKIQDEAVNSTNFDVLYYGFATINGKWYILEVNDLNKTYRYVNGTSDYLDNWNSRENLTYDYIFNLTW